MVWELVTVAGVALAGSALVLQPQGRVGAVALGLLSAFWGVLVGLAADPVVGLVQAVAGVTAVALINLSGPLPEDTTQRRPASGNDDSVAPAFRLVAVVMGIVVAYGLSRTLPLRAEGVVSPVSFAWYWLVVVALTLLLLGRDLARAGYGLLLLGIAGPSFYLIVTTRAALGVGVAGAAVTLLLALSLAYLYPPPKTSAPGGAAGDGSP